MNIYEKYRAVLKPLGNNPQAGAILVVAEMLHTLNEEIKGLRAELTAKASVSKEAQVAFRGNANKYQSAKH